MSLINRYKNIVLVICVGCGWLACDQKAPANNNQVTVNPPVTNPIDKFAQLGIDKSPMDMSYYPVDYPKLKMSGNTTEPLIARVIYSRPQKNGRSIFGSVVKYGSIWRLGANEATEIEFFKGVTINNQKVLQGRYTIYCVPSENTWSIILNNDLFTWGLKIDSTKDVYKFEIPVAKTNFPFEVFTMEFQKAEPANNMQLVMEWDSIRAILPIKY
jgi:Protein of unknown function (DUF2911)